MRYKLRLCRLRNTEPGPNDVYTDGDLVIDQNGLRRISPSITSLNGGRSSTERKQTSSFSIPIRGMEMDIDDDCISVASTQPGEPLLSEFSLSPQAQPSLAHNRHEAVIARESKFIEANQRFDRTSSKGYQSTRALNSKSKSNDLCLKNLSKLGEVGRGSSGVVYRVHDRQSGLIWALKEVPLQADEDKRRMTIDELRTAHKVDHANIVSCHEVFYHRGVFSLVMDYMDGGSMLDNLKSARDRLMPLSVLAHVCRCVSFALVHLHEELGVVHRDVKPGNILLSLSGDVQLADLGICTRPGELKALPSTTKEEPCEIVPATAWVGTVTYMSAERLTGCGYSFSADVWSLGIVLAEAALGRYPYSLTPPSRPAVADAAEARALQFWDLLDLVLDGPCPSRTVAEECLARSSAEDAQVPSFPSIARSWLKLAGVAGTDYTCALQGLSCLVARCLDRDAASRITARAVADHPFLARACPDAAAGRAAMAQWLGLVHQGRDAVAVDGGGGQKPLQQTLERGLEGLLSLFVRTASTEAASASWRAC